MYAIRSYYVDLFKDFVVEIDYDDNKLTLTKPEHYKERVYNRDIVMPIHFEHNKPYIRTTIVTDKNEYVPVKLLVDTGASDAIWLSTVSDERIILPEKNIRTFLGRGLSGDFVITSYSIHYTKLYESVSITIFLLASGIFSLIIAKFTNGMYRGILLILSILLCLFAAKYEGLSHRNSKIIIDDENFQDSDFNIRIANYATSFLKNTTTVMSLNNKEENVILINVSASGDFVITSYSIHYTKLYEVSRQRNRCRRRLRRSHYH